MIASFLKISQFNKINCDYTFLFTFFFRIRYIAKLIIYIVYKDENRRNKINLSSLKFGSIFDVENNVKFKTLF